MLTIRDGVTLQPDAAYALLRIEHRLGRAADVNRTYADYDTQLAMWNAWNRYVNSGYDPRLYPGHSRALHPDESVHCQGLAWDTDDWTTPGFIDLAAEHGWIRTAAWDPSEQHHFEYQQWNDSHHDERVTAAPWSRDDYDPRPATTEESDEMEAYVARPDGTVVHLIRGAQHEFRSQREYELYQSEVEFIRARGGIQTLPVPALSAVVKVNWDTFKRLQDNFGIEPAAEVDPPKA